MNQSEDWDIIWKWQWFRRALWQPHFKDVTHPEGRPARIAPIWNWILRKYGAERVLDCNCGLGLRTILLHEDGFDAVGADSSGTGVRHAQELAEFRETPVTFHHCPWNTLGEHFGAEFDAIVNDAFAWTMSRADLRFACHNFHSVLKPGGVLVFTGADQWTPPEARAALVDHAWRSAPRFQIRADYSHGDTHLSLVVARDQHELGVVENYVFVIRDEHGPRLETAAICNSVQWTWDDFQSVCKEAGFSSLESVKVPVGRKEHILNVARK